MGSENEIPKYELDGVDCLRYCYGGSPKLSEVPESEVEWSDPEDLLVRYADHVAARKADHKRIAELEARVKSNEHLTDRLNETRSYWIGQVEPQVEEQYAARLAAAEKLADAVEQSGGVAPGPGPIGSALAAFRASLSGETD